MAAPEKNDEPPRSILIRDREDEAAKREFNISSSDEEEDYTGRTEDAGENESAKDVGIRLNPKARKVGAPKKPKKITVAGEKEGRKWYDAAEQGRKKAEEVTLDALIVTLNRETPGLVETERRLSGIIVKFKDAESKKPKFKRVKNPVLIMDTFFALPPKLLDACLKVLPVANTESSAIDLDEAVHTRNSSNNGPFDVVQIKDVGAFSRSQIETFKKVENLREAVRFGLDMHKWLIEEGIPSLPVEYHELAKSVSNEILSTHPYKEIGGLPAFPDFRYTLVYRATHTTYLAI